MFTLGLLGCVGGMLPIRETKFFPSSDVPVQRNSEQASERTDPSIGSCWGSLVPKSVSLCFGPYYAHPGCRKQTGTSCPTGDYKSKELWAVAESPSNTLLAAVWPQPFGSLLLSTFLPLRVTRQTKVINTSFPQCPSRFNGGLPGGFKAVVLG